MAKAFIDKPLAKIQILREKYQDEEPGRIPLPKNIQQLWSQHKYSVMARDPKLYKSIGQHVADNKSKADYAQLAVELIHLLRTPPSSGGVMNALQHMWGYVSDIAGRKPATFYQQTPKRLLLEIQYRVIEKIRPASFTPPP